MTKTAIKDKVLNVQAQLDIIMKALGDRPDFAVDEKNWKKLEVSAKDLRKAVYQKVY